MHPLARQGEMNEAYGDLLLEPQLPSNGDKKPSNRRIRGSRCMTGKVYNYMDFFAISNFYIKMSYRHKNLLCFTIFTIIQKMPLYSIFVLLVNCLMKYSFTFQLLF